jgi:hypothetical protein
MEETQMTGVETTHRTDEMTIIRKVLALQVASAKLPSWTGSNTTGWQTPRSEFFNVGAAEIIAEHGLNMDGWHWFCERAQDLRAAERKDGGWPS